MKHFLKQALCSKAKQKILTRDDLPKSLVEYLQTDIINFNTRLQDVEFLVLDFETTGLNPATDKVVSIGYTVIKDMYVQVASSKHFLVQPKTDMNEQSVVIHGITDSLVQDALSVSQMMDILLSVIKNRVIIVHFDNIEVNFINCICQKLYGFQKLPMQVVDTMKIQMRKNRNQSISNNATSMRLFNLREDYGLPRYKSHNAMQDAIATAELFLAQLSYMDKQDKLLLKDVII